MSVVSGAAKTILVLDDEQSIHYVFDRILKSKYQLLHSYNVKEAIAKSFLSKEVDLVITDVFLGGETGLELVGRIRELVDDIPIIIISAYADAMTAEVIHKIENTFNCHFVRKPFDNEEMEALVASILAA